ncbi:MAG: hypothetical protein ACLQME_23135 [Alphaproteobacteria bacterium]
MLGFLSTGNPVNLRSVRLCPVILPPCCLVGEPNLIRIGIAGGFGH